MSSVMVVTGTDTGVGKTIVTAAIAAALGHTAGRAREDVTRAGKPTGIPGGGDRGETPAATRYGVAVVKPAQTGDDSDVDTVGHLAGPAFTKTLASFPDPLAPLAAARVAGLEPLDLYAVTDAVKEISASHELTLVEGAGGLLVPMGLRPSGAPWTIADLAVALDAPAVVVVRAGLGTLNHTALTLEALDRRGVTAHVVIGAWPASPELVHFTNLDDLPGPLHGLLPDAAGALAPGVFRRSAPGWFTPDLYGTCDNLHDLAETLTD